MKKRLVVDNMHKRKKRKTKAKTRVAEQDLPPQFPDDLVLELCTRLPMKKLVQCMSVSKGFSSIIHHTSFTEAYRRRNRCIIVAHRKYQGSFYYCTLGVDEAKQFVNPYNFNLRDRNGKQKFTEVVNGLVCAYNSENVFICSVWTGEIMKLPGPPGIQGDRNTSVYFRYFLGFAPVNRVYKLLAMKESINGSSSSFSYHILTLGDTDSSWRALDSSSNVPKLSYVQSLRVNGVFYWLTHEREIISFNLNEEKFCFIQPPKIDGNRFALYKFTQFRGRLSLYYPIAHIRLIMHTLEDDEGIVWTKNETIYTNELQCRPYTRVIPLPRPRGGVLLINGETQGSFTHACSYNYENNEFEKFVLGKWPYAVHVENNVYISCELPDFRSIDELIGGWTT